MKRYLFVSAIATMALASCSSDDFLGDVPGNTPNAVKPTEIGFGGEAGKISRSQIESEAAATALNNRFWVYGVKNVPVTQGEGSTASVVFKNYLVKYTDPKTEFSTESNNNKSWMYDGLKNSSDKLFSDEKTGSYSSGKDAFSFANAIKETTTSQSLKYWDYSATSYTFTAFSAKPSDLDGNNPKISITKTEGKEEYSITLKEGASLGDLYFSKKKEVQTNDFNKDNAVKFEFISALARIRVGMYTDITGYNVKIKKFYYGDGQESTTNFKANAEGTVVDTNDKTYKVTYEADGTPKLEAPDVSRTSGTTSTIELGSNLTSKDLGTSKEKVVYDTEGENQYTCFLPHKANKDMEIKVDYELTSVDGSKETIYVTGATVKVGSTNLDWKPNHAYTYIFKISDKKENGSTGGANGSVAGLFPITFDAVVDAENTTDGSYDGEFTDPK